MANMAWSTLERVRAFKVRTARRRNIHGLFTLEIVLGVDGGGEGSVGGDVEIVQEVLLLWENTMQEGKESDLGIHQGNQNGHDTKKRGRSGLEV
jgi:hypothetical protein